MKELLDIYDCNHKFLKTTDRVEAHKNGLWHDVFQCLILNGDKAVFQLRSKDKDSNAGLLDISSAGHISSGEKLEDGIREIDEELGLKVEFDNLKYIGYYQEAIDLYDAKYKPFQKRHFCHMFLLKSNTNLLSYKLQKEELDGIFEISISDCLKLFSKEVNKVEIHGYLLENDEMIENIRKVCIKDFTIKNIWLTLFIMAERFLNGKKYLHI